MPRVQAVAKSKLSNRVSVWPHTCSLIKRTPEPLAREDEIVEGENKMLHYALIFFLIAIVAAVLGFGGISVASAGIAKILFVLFLVVFLVTLVMGVARRA